MRQSVHGSGKEAETESLGHEKVRKMGILKEGGDRRLRVRGRTTGRDGKGGKLWDKTETKQCLCAVRVQKRQERRQPPFSRQAPRLLSCVPPSG